MVMHHWLSHFNNYLFLRLFSWAPWGQSSEVREWGWPGHSSCQRPQVNYPYFRLILSCMVSTTSIYYNLVSASYIKNFHKSRFKCIDSVNAWVSTVVVTYISPSKWVFENNALLHVLIWLVLIKTWSKTPRSISNNLCMKGFSNYYIPP